MDVRGMLVELVGDCKYWGSCEEMADYLIANGVMVQQWVPVSERPPEEEGRYIVIACDERCSCGEGIWYDTVEVEAEYYDGEWLWNANGTEYDITCFVTHWTPLPQPPVDFTGMFKNVSADDLRTYSEKTQPPKGE